MIEIAPFSSFAAVTDYVANGSFASLKENVTYSSVPGFAWLVRLVDYSNGWDGDRVYVDESAYRFLRKSELESGDVIISNVGANAGTVFQAPVSEMPMTLGPNSVRVRPLIDDPDERRYLYFLLASPEGQSRLKSILAGSAQPKFNKTDLRALTFPYETDHQKRVEIAKTLGALDDKIELNRQMNKTLEELARAIFKSWFVDFDPVHAKARGERPIGMDDATADLFPDSFEDSPFGPIPAGWRMDTVEDVCTLIENGGTPKRQEPDYWNGDVPWFKTGELTDGPLLKSEESITDLGLKESSCRLWDAGTILIALYASPTVGRLGMLTERGTANQACSALVADPKVGKQFLFNWLYFTRDELQRIAVGAAQQNISQQVLRKHRVIVPSATVCEAFNSMSFDPWATRCSLLAESGLLVETRDLLLPVLVSRGTVGAPDSSNCQIE